MAFYSDSAKARILSIDPTAANWINTRPYRSPTARTARPEAAARPNQYPGPCQRCHGHVAAGQGILGEKSGGKFLIFHADGTCPDQQPTAQAPTTTANRYGGKCTECGVWVEPEAGIRVKVGAKWEAAHRGGQCPKPTEPTAQAPGRQQNAPVNLYGGPCAECREWVEAKAGIRIKTDSGKWEAAHLPGQCPEDIEEAEGGRIELTAEQIDQLPTGYATVELADGDWRTFRLRLRKETARRHPGALEISYLAGSDNENSYMPLGVVKDGALICRKAIGSDGMRDALAVLLADPAAAQLGWTLGSGCCNRCGRTLTVPTSLHNGRGPECVNKR